MSPENLNPLAELKSLDIQVEQVNDLAGLKPIFFRLDEIAKANPDNFEVQLVAGDVKQHLVNRGTKLKAHAAATVLPPAEPPPLGGPFAPPPSAAPPPLGGTPPFPPPTMGGPSPMPPPPLPPLDGPPVDLKAPRKLMSSGQFTPPGAPRSEPGPPPIDSSQIPTIYMPSPGPMPAAQPPLGRLSSSPPRATTETPSLGPPFAPPPPAPPLGMSGPPPVPPMSPPMSTMTPPPGGLPPTGPPSKQGWKRPLWTGAIMGVVIALVGIALLVNLARKRNAGKTAGTTVAVAIATVPPGASIRVNGEMRCTSDCSLQLDPGNYQIVAFLDGYETAASGVTVAAGQPGNVSLNLEPAAQSVRVLTDLDQGKVTFDDQPPADLVEGQFVMEKVQPGIHTIKVTGRTGDASLQFELAVAKLPAIAAPLSTRNLLGVAVLSFASQARVVTSAGPLKLAVNGQPQTDATPDGVSLENYQPGVSELVIGEGATQRNMKESFGPAPAVTLFLKSDQNVGTLIVSTGENDARVFLNNREYPRRTQRGELRIPTIGRVAVRVAKDGFDPPPVQNAEVKKGAELRMEFKLNRTAEFATLVVTGGTAGANVVIDARQVGAIGADGSFNHSSVLPGAHAIEIRRDGFVALRLNRTFRAGETVTLTGPDVQLASDHPAPPTLPPPPPVEVKKPELPAPKPQLAAAPKIGTMADFDQPAQWKEEDGVWTHRGQAFLTFKTPPRGTFEFTVHLVKGGNIFRGGRVRWFANFIDAKNYALFEMDDKNFWGEVVENGKKLERSRAQHKQGEKQWTLQVEIAAERIIHRVMVGGQWVNLDVWAEQGRNFADGKFGFLVQGNDEIGLSDFKFTPAR